MTRSSIHPEDADPTSAGDILDDLRAVVREAESLLRDADGEVGDRVSEVRNKIEATLEDAKDSLREAGEKGGRVKAAAHSAEAYVRENPLTALLIAAGLGYVIGNLGRRR